MVAGTISDFRASKCFVGRNLPEILCYTNHLTGRAHKRKEVPISFTAVKPCGCGAEKARVELAKPPVKELSDYKSAGLASCPTSPHRHHREGLLVGHSTHYATW